MVGRRNHLQQLFSRDMRLQKRLDRFFKIDYTIAQQFSSLILEPKNPQGFPWGS